MVPRVFGRVFIFCPPGNIFGVTECVEPRFRVLRYGTCLRRFQVCRASFSRFELRDAFSAWPSASCPVVRVLRSRTCFRSCRVRGAPISRIALPNALTALRSASGPVFPFCDSGRILGVAECVLPIFAFCPPGLVFGVTACVVPRIRVLHSRTRIRRYRLFGPRFHVLRSRTYFRRCRVRRGPCTHFALPDEFAALPRASVLRSWTRFGRYRVRSVAFSSFALPDTFSMLLCASSPVFMFCAPGNIFSIIECVGPRFRVFTLRDVFSALSSASGPRFCYGTRFRRGRMRLAPFFTLDLFLELLSAWGPIFAYCASGRIYGVIERVGTHFPILRFWTRFRRCRVRRVCVLVLRSRTCFRRYRGRRAPYSRFALPETDSALPSASGPVFTFCAPGLVFGVTDFVGPRFRVLCYETCFRRCRVRRAQFSCFALPDTYSALPIASGPVFTFCAPGLIFSVFECIGPRGRVLHSRTCFRRYRLCRASF